MYCGHCSLDLVQPYVQALGCLLVQRLMYVCMYAVVYVLVIDIHWSFVNPNDVVLETPLVLRLKWHCSGFQKRSARLHASRF